jgi:hypothetical protein
VSEIYLVGEHSIRRVGLAQQGELVKGLADSGASAIFRRRTALSSAGAPLPRSDHADDLPQYPARIPGQNARSHAIAVRAAMLCVCWSFGEGTFAGKHGNGRDAPKPAVRPATIGRLKPTLLSHSAFALGIVLLPHLGGLFQASAWPLYFNES